MKGAVHFHDLDTEATARFNRAKSKRESSTSSLGNRRTSASSRKHTATNESSATHVEMDLKSMLLRDPRDTVGLIMRRDEDFEGPVLGCTALKSGVGGNPIVICTDEHGTTVCYDAAHGDLVGKLSSYVNNGHAYDIPEEGYTKPISVKAGRKLCMRKGIDDATEDGLNEDGLGPSASVESLEVQNFDHLDSVRSALSKKSITGCGSDCITIVAGGTELFEWGGEEPAVPTAESEIDESAVDKGMGNDKANEKSLKSIASTSVLSDTDVSPMPATSLAVFALGDVFAALCPGIAQCCGGGDGMDEVLGGAPARHLAVSLFSRLTPAQRKDPNLVLSHQMLGIKPGHGKRGTSGSGLGVSRQGSSRGGSRAGSRAGSRGGLLTRNTTTETMGSGGGKGHRSSSGRIRNTTAGSMKSIGSYHTAGNRSLASGSVTSGGGGGEALSAEHISNFLGKARAQGMKKGDQGVVWKSDPAGIMSKMIKGGGTGKGEREERIKKRREELLAMLT